MSRLRPRGSHAPHVIVAPNYISAHCDTRVSVWKVRKILSCRGMCYAYDRRLAMGRNDAACELARAAESSAAGSSAAAVSQLRLYMS